MEDTPACFALSLLLTATMSNCQVRQPSAFESAVAIPGEAPLTIGESQYRNPLSASTENIRRGQEVFSNYCFACHGLDDQKTGVPFAESMSPTIPSPSSPKVQG
jgi:mono/diheme cytochrome c family protein